MTIFGNGGGYYKINGRSVKSNFKHISFYLGASIFSLDANNWFYEICDGKSIQWNEIMIAPKKWA